MEIEHKIWYFEIGGGGYNQVYKGPHIFHQSRTSRDSPKRFVRRTYDTKPSNPQQGAQ